MRFNPAFLQLFPSLDEANDFHTSVDNANPSRTWLRLVPGEVYNQYIILQDSAFRLFELQDIRKARLVDTDLNILVEDLGFGFKKFLDSKAVLISFKIPEDFGDKCLALQLQLSAGADESNRAVVVYSNIFTCSENNRVRTSLVSYWHLENHYGIPYREDTSGGGGFGISQAQLTDIRNQIRLPLYFLNWKTEQDSSESFYASATPANINISRVKRREIKNWQVIANDWINQRLAIVSDSDYVYIDGLREITRPYEYSEVNNGGDFSISSLESQPKLGDTFKDDHGLVNHRPVITAISFPNGSCCTPDGSAPIEPTIISDVEQPANCTYGGKRRRVSVQGQPNSTIKYHVTCSALQGTAKQLSVSSGTQSESFTFLNTSQNFVGFFYIGTSGQADIVLRFCLEDCTPGVPIEFATKLELYRMDGTTLSGQSSSLSEQKTCPLPYSPTWLVNSQTGSHKKNLRVLGNANSTAIIAVKVLSAVANHSATQKNFVMLEGLSIKTDVYPLQEWDVPISIGTLGNSANFDVEVFAGSFAGLVPPESSVYVSLTLRDSSGALSNNVVGLSHINTL